MLAIMRGKPFEDNEQETINARVLTTSSLAKDAVVYLTAMDGKGVYAVPASALPIGATVSNAAVSSIPQASSTEVVASKVKVSSSLTI